MRTTVNVVSGIEEAFIISICDIYKVNYYFTYDLYAFLLFKGRVKVKKPEDTVHAIEIEYVMQFLNAIRSLPYFKPLSKTPKAGTEAVLKMMQLDRALRSKTRKDHNSGISPTLFSLETSMRGEAEKVLNDRIGFVDFNSASDLRECLDSVISALENMSTLPVENLIKNVSEVVVKKLFLSSLVDLQSLIDSFTCFYSYGAKTIEDIISSLTDSVGMKENKNTRKVSMDYNRSKKLSSLDTISDMRGASAVDIVIEDFEKKVVDKSLQVQKYKVSDEDIKDLILLVDMSSSMNRADVPGSPYKYSRLEFMYIIARAVARKLFSRGNRLTVYGFNDTARLLGSFDCEDEFLAKVSRYFLSPGSGSTDICTSLFQVADAAKSSDNILILTDAVDRNLTHSPDAHRTKQIKSRLQKNTNTSRRDIACIHCLNSIHKSKYSGESLSQRMHLSAQRFIKDILCTEEKRYSTAFWENSIPSVSAIKGM